MFNYLQGKKMFIVAVKHNNSIVISFFILMATCFGALHVPQVSVRWPDDDQERSKPVAIKIKETNNYICYCCV